MVTTTVAVTNAMQIVEYHVKHNTTTDQNPPEADHCGDRGKGKPKKMVSTKYYLKHVGTLEGGYVLNVDLPRVPRIQSTSLGLAGNHPIPVTHRFHVFPRGAISPDC
jgi:hypothetical protein